MRGGLILLLAFTSAASAADQAHFFGTWEPRPLLREFWRPVTENWWSCNKRHECGPNLRLRKRCEEFARTHSPNIAVREMILDLAAFQSLTNEFVYLSIMMHWPRKTVLSALDSLSHSPDAGVREIAEEAREDFVGVQH